MQNKTKTTKKTLAPKKAIPAKRDYLIFAIPVILIMTCLIYSNIFNNQILTFDDNEYFEKYPEILHLSWHSLKLFFTNYYEIMYQPLPVLSFAINYYFTKLDVVQLHLINISFHIFNILLIYYFIYILSGKQITAIIVSALFAIHPMNSEAVLWISARSSGLYAFFYVLSIIFYLKYIRTVDNKQTTLINKNKLSNIHYPLSIVFFIISLFSKAQAVTLPLVLFLIDWYLQRKEYKKIVIEKIPFLILSFIFGIIALSDKGTTDLIGSAKTGLYNYTDMFVMLSYSVFFYLYKILLPFNLCAAHVYPIKTDGYLPSLYYLSLVVLIILLILLLLIIKKRKYVLFGISFFLISISINLQMIPSRIFIVSERYGYLPFLGIFFIIGEFYTEVIEKKTANRKFTGRIMTVILICFILLCCIETWERNKVWKDNLSFMTDIIEKNPPALYISRPYRLRANEYDKENNFEFALNDYSKAIEIRPDDDLAYYGRGQTNFKIHNYQTAIKDLDKSISLKPGSAAVIYNRAIAKYNVHDYQGALEDCNNAIKLKTDNAEAYSMRGVIKYSFNDFKGSEYDFTNAIKLNPDNSEYYKNRASLYINLNNIDKACNDLTKASQMGNQDAAGLLQQYCKNKF